MGSSTNPDRFDTGASQDMTRRAFITWLTAFLAAQASNVLWQTLPSKYDEIMAALTNWELTYEQLIEIGKKHGATFNDDQRKVLSGELAKLKIQKGKSKIPLNERPEDKAKRLAEEKKQKEIDKMTKNINIAYFDKKNWTSFHKKDVAEVNIWKDKVGMKFVTKELKINRADLYLPPLPIVEWDYKIDITSTGTGMIWFWAYDTLGQLILEKGQDRTFLQNGVNSISLPKGIASIKFFLATTPANKEIEVSQFSINKTTEGNRLAWNQ